ncbi:MAG: single-stranded DNA-binding protein [Verrucomicrobia bacterium]|jgi:single-strand DNA-binding protein|nr:MAG: single-stranded DNA-binding protein [Verrucomicrobiota bacterium]
MANLNKVLLLGNLTRDPELRYTPKGTAVADIAVAINRVWNNEQNQRQEETTFVDITLWGRQAEIAQQYLTKGRGVFIEGRLQMDSWEDKASGQKRSKLKVVAENLQFMPDGKGNAGGGYSSNSGGSSSTPARSSNPAPMHGASADDSGFQEEDDIPF